MLVSGHYNWVLRDQLFLTERIWEAMERKESTMDFWQTLQLHYSSLLILIHEIMSFSQLMDNFVGVYGWKATQLHMQDIDIWVVSFCMWSNGFFNERFSQTAFFQQSNTNDAHLLLRCCRDNWVHLQEFWLAQIWDQFDTLLTTLHASWC